MGDPIGEWFRGEITSRRLSILIDGLPEGSPLHLAESEGKVWTLENSIAWQQLGQLARLNGYVRAWLKIKPHQDKFSWPSTPWEDKGKSSTQYGSVAPEDREDAVAYLLALNPTAGE